MSSAQDSTDGAFPTIRIGGQTWEDEEPQPFYIQKLTFEGVTSVKKLHDRAEEVYGPLDGSYQVDDSDAITSEDVYSGVEDAIWSLADQFAITVTTDPMASRALSLTKRAEAMLDALKDIRLTTSAGDAGKARTINRRYEIAKHNLSIYLECAETGEGLGSPDIPSHPGECALKAFREFLNRTGSAGAISFRWEPQLRMVHQVSHVRKNLHANATTWVKAQGQTVQASADA